MFYPINLNLENVNITIIGGGKIAYRKCMSFLMFTKNITVISKDFVSEFNNIKDEITLIKDVYKEQYIKESFIVVASTDNRELNKEIGLYCKNNNKLFNIVDNKELSNIIIPSIIKKGDLVISISTNGKSPSLSSKIKRDLEYKYNDYEEYINLLGEIRNKVIEKCNDKDKKQKILNELVNLNLKELKNEYKKYL